MDLTQLANLGEFIGGVAVLVTLLYLAVQVRGNTKREKAESHRAIVQEWNRTFLGPMGDPNSVEILRRAMADFDSLNGTDQTVAAALFAGTMNLGQQVNALRMSDNVDAEFAANVEDAVVAIVQVPGVARWWELMGRAYALSFRERIEARLASPTCPPPMTEYMPWLAVSAPEPDRAQS